jgi:DNA primase
LPPYGISEFLRLPRAERREVVLLEGLMDVHQLRAQGFQNVASMGGARLQSATIPRLSRFGLESIVLAFDNDPAGRDGLSLAVQELTQPDVGFGLRVLEPRLLDPSKDPDEFVRANGVGRFAELVDGAECAVTWRALELVDGVSSQEAPGTRRAALARAGRWLGTLPARLSLEQEDAVRRVADQCGYSRVAVERAFRARFWSEPSTSRSHGRDLVAER